MLLQSVQSAGDRLTDTVIFCPQVKKKIKNKNRNRNENKNRNENENKNNLNKKIISFLKISVRCCSGKILDYWKKNTAKTGVNGELNFMHI